MRLIIPTVVSSVSIQIHSFIITRKERERNDDDDLQFTLDIRISTGERISWGGFEGEEGGGSLIEIDIPYVGGFKRRAIQTVSGRRVVFADKFEGSSPGRTGR